MKKKFVMFGKKIFRFFTGKKRKPFVYVAIGDSTVEGIGATTNDKSLAGRIFAFLREHKKQVTYHNFGKAFATVQDVLDYQLADAIAANPDFVLIAVGANDIQQHTSTKIFEKEYEKLLSTLKKQTKAIIIVNTIPDISSLQIVPQLARLYCRWMVQRFNARINKNAEKTGIPVVDAYQRSCDLRKIYKNYKELLFSDGVHPSDRGYALWAESIIQQITPIIC